MRPDLQELEITLGELKRLTGLNWQKYQKSKRVYLLSPIGTILSLQMYLLGMLGSFFGIGAFGLLYHSGDFWVFILCALPSMFFFWLLARLGNEYNKTNVFGKEINQYYQLILNINTLDQLEAVGNPVKLNEREKVLEALRINRENLVRALQTERILRENPQFRPEQFNIDLSDLRSLQATEKATEYGRFLDEALQIGVSVQTEMRKLENKRLGL
ncbi:CDP-alcohol phosphatidyltransferase family protein [Microcystis viridis]|uniref:CDP-alcohol phosphatidyltransferase family protein n=1 Tax=Microcystis viridis FACHB-1342 TaxID=2692900 RepID=A0ABR8GBM1_MICVR|nr:CDP-alcohol phosphatidyltransferase family protein [Microcystis viridis]MBD2600388.1 CDP-alcohol phosphatidyltransferase family protein [Microcystis viridis FACHB-1342]